MPRGRLKIISELKSVRQKTEKQKLMKPESCSWEDKMNLQPD